MARGLPGADQSTPTSSFSSERSCKRRKRYKEEDNSDEDSDPRSPLVNVGNTRFTSLSPVISGDGATTAHVRTFGIPELCSSNQWSLPSYCRSY